MATFNSSNATLAADCRGEVGDYFTVYYACSVSLFTLLLVPAVNSIRTFQPNALAAHWYLSCKGHGLLLVALGLLARATSMAGVWISCSVEVWTEIVWVFSHMCCIACYLAMIAYLAEICQEGLDWAWSPRAAPTRLYRPLVCIMTMYLAAEVTLSSLLFTSFTCKAGEMCTLFLVRLCIEMAVLIGCSAAGLYYSHHIIKFCTGSWGQRGKNKAAVKLVSVAIYLRFSVLLTWLYVACLSMYVVIRPPRFTWTWLWISAGSRLLEGGLIGVMQAYYGVVPLQSLLAAAAMVTGPCSRRFSVQEGEWTQPDGDAEGVSISSVGVDVDGDDEGAGVGHKEGGRTSAGTGEDVIIVDNPSRGSSRRGSTVHGTDESSSFGKQAL